MKRVCLIGDVFESATQIAAVASSGWTRGADGAALYTIKSGDTLGSLATKYLGSWARYMELFNAQPSAWRTKAPRNNNPDLIFVGEILIMPPDAEAAAIRLNLLAAAPAPAPAAAPAIPGWPSSLPVPGAAAAPAPAPPSAEEPPPYEAAETVITASPPTRWPWLLLALAAGGGAAWWYWRESEEVGAEVPAL
jgi:LysM domain